MHRSLSSSLVASIVLAASVVACAPASSTTTPHSGALAANSRSANGGANDTQAIRERQRAEDEATLSARTHAFQPVNDHPDWQDFTFLVIDQSEDEQDSTRDDQSVTTSVKVEGIYLPQPSAEKLRATVSSIEDRPGTGVVGYCVAPDGSVFSVQTLVEYPDDPVVDQILRETVKTWKLRVVNAPTVHSAVCLTRAFNIAFK